MNTCRVCEGVVVQCPHCKHYHCDDACRPVACQQADEEE